MALVPRIKATMVEDGAITSSKLADSAITSGKLADNSIVNSKMADDAINAAEIINSAVSSSKITTDLSQRIIPAVSGEFSFPGDNATQSWAHGLGAVPSRFRVVLRCVSNQFGYVTGDEIDITSNLDGDGGRGTTAKADAANVYVRSNSWSAYYVNRYDSVNTVPLTPANWRIVFRAWK